MDHDHVSRSVLRSGLGDTPPHDRRRYVKYNDREKTKRSEPVQNLVLAHDFQKFRDPEHSVHKYTLAPITQETLEKKKPK